MFGFDRVAELIEVQRAEADRANSGSDNGLYLLEDGSAFKGQVVRGFVHCHAKDLPRLLLPKGAVADRTIATSRTVNFFNSSRFRSDNFNINSAKFFRGTLTNGNKNGFCHVVDWQGNEFKGFFVDNCRTGHGFYSEKEKLVYVGDFSENRIQGQGVMLIKDQQLMKGEFFDGFLRGLGYIKYFGSNIEFFGQVLRNLKHGTGVLRFRNNYNFEGFFKDGEIDTSSERGKLVNREEERVEEALFVPSKFGEVGILQTLDGLFYVLDFKNGIVRRTIV